MCIDNFIFKIKKNLKVEISREEYEELVKAYAEYKDLRKSFTQLHFLSGLSYEELKQINWSAFNYLPINNDTKIIEESEDNARYTKYKVQFEGEFIKIGDNKKQC